MIALAICIAAFLFSFAAGRVALWAGLCTMLSFGYLYGIVRAQFPTAFSHFIFDAAVIGFYASQPWFSLPRMEQIRSRAVGTWVAVLIGWPSVLCLLPMQTLLISIVGFRGNAFFLPMLLIGTRMNARTMLAVCYGVAALNLVSFGFGGGEYVLGVERFYPRNSVTEIIYNSTDVGEGLLRIPATFVTSHAYAATMVTTLPFLFGAVGQKQRWPGRFLLGLGIAGALLGVMMASTRTYFALAVVLSVVALFRAEFSKMQRFAVMAAIAFVLLAAMTTERFGRFRTLTDSETVSSRVKGSVNRTFIEVLLQYPMGNGLGGGGTSIPHFLQGQLRKPVSIESEYGRILLEQGVIGLLIWVAFIGWCFIRYGYKPVESEWTRSRLLFYLMIAMSFGAATIGTGLMTTIPATALFLMAIGWVVSGNGYELPTVDARRTFTPAAQREEMVDAAIGI